MGVPAVAWMWRVNNLHVAPARLLTGLGVQLILALWMQIAIYVLCGSLPKNAQSNCIVVPG